MPDEILEEIFNFLDIGSKKSFSLVCKKFNQIFGLLKCLDRVKFCVTKERGEICDITRQYQHIVEPGNLIPVATLPKLTHLTSYTIDKDFLIHIKANYFVGLLPYLRNLSCLDILQMSYTQSIENQILQINEDRMGFEVVEMKYLKTLKIDLKLFGLLIDRFVKFSCSKLTDLKIISKYGYNRYNGGEVGALKSLIMSQKYLQVLSLSMDTHKITELFDAPFIVHSQLKKFRLSESYSSRASEFNSTQQDHLADFLMTQTALQELTITIGTGTPATSKLQHLMNSRLHMPLVKRKIWMVKEHQVNRINFYIFTIDELAQSKKPNQATKHLKISLHQITSEAYRAAVEFVSLNYPGLMALELFGYINPFNGIDAINKLKHMESLTLPLYEFETPSAIKISTLKILHIFQHYDDGGDGKWKAAYKTNLKSFFQNHKLIEEIIIEIDGYAERNVYDKMDSEFNEIAENALMQLHSLRKFIISVDWHLIDDPDDTDSNKTLLDGWTSSSKVFAESMRKYAKCAFVLQCDLSCSSESKKLMKTFDGAVVEIE